MEAIGWLPGSFTSTSNLRSCAEFSMTPAIRLLEKKKVPHSIHAYRHDPATTSYGLEAAEALGLDPSLVFKTLLVNLASGNAQYAVVVIPVNRQLDLKKVASVFKAKKVTMCDAEIAQRLTGYLVGGISPLAQKKRLPVIMDACSQDLETLYVSGGKRGLDIGLAPEDLKHLVSATVVPVSRTA